MKYQLTLGLLCFIGSILNAQYSWDIKDPIDFNFIDIGDNKVILYNGIGLGLTLWLDKDKNPPNIELPNSSVHIQYYQEYDQEPLSNLLKLGYRRRYRVLDFLYIGGELNATYANDSYVSTLGLGTEMVFEWHLIRKEEFRLIYDNGVGPNYFFDPFPFGGTKFSFSTHYGIRIEFLTGQRWYNISISNLHISNAGIKGEERNPALDAIGVSAGFLF